jgi:hypothetical protein
MIELACYMSYVLTEMDKQSTKLNSAISDRLLTSDIQQSDRCDC